MDKKNLPIGSVVILEGKERKLMITGYRSKASGEDIVYDYNGILFPEGLMENRYALFNADDIVEVFYEGLKNENYDKYIKTINEMHSGGVVTLTNADGSKRVERVGKRAPSKPSEPMSISEMRAKYTKVEISSGQTEMFDFDKLKK